MSIEESLERIADALEVIASSTQGTQPLPEVTQTVTEDIPEKPKKTRKPKKKEDDAEQVGTGYTFPVKDEPVVADPLAGLNGGPQKVAIPTNEDILTAARSVTVKKGAAEGREVLIEVIKKYGFKDYNTIPDEQKADVLKELEDAARN